MSILSEIKKNKRVLFLDIDGVLADCTHRLKYIKGKKKDYDKFYGEVSKDTPLQEYDFITNLSEAYNGNVVFLTGRRQSCSQDTFEWLRKHYGLPKDETTLICREDGDHRPAPECKAEGAVQYIKHEFSNGHKIKACMVVDDMQENVQAVVDALSEVGVKRVMGCLYSDGSVTQES